MKAHKRLRRIVDRLRRWPPSLFCAPVVAVFCLAAASLINLPAVLGTAGLVWIAARGVLRRRRLRRERGMVLRLIRRIRTTRLIPRDAVPWKDPEGVAAKARPLQDLGFSIHGTFERSLDRSLSYLILISPENNAGAAITEQDGGPSLALFSYYEDGHIAIISNWADPWEAVMPGSYYLHRPAASPEELYRLLLESREKSRLAPLTAESLPGQFERYDALFFDWLEATLEAHYAPLLANPFMPQKLP